MHIFTLNTLKHLKHSNIGLLSMKPFAPPVYIDENVCKTGPLPTILRQALKVPKREIFDVGFFEKIKPNQAKEQGLQTILILFKNSPRYLNFRQLCAVSIYAQSLCACSMCAYCYYALAQHKHIVITRMLSINIVKVKNCLKFMLMLSQSVVTICLG